MAIGPPGRSPRRLGVAALPVAAMLLPWLAFATLTRWPSSPMTAASADAPAREAALAAMLLGPSAPKRVPAGHAGVSSGRLDAAGAPKRIVVPALGLDAPVVPVSGVSGTLLPPSDARTIGWWREGREPGAAVGSAVLAGHTVHTGGGAFDDLGRLHGGDTVLVHTERGWIRYAVSRAATYRKGRLATAAAALFARSGPGRLVLVTCSEFDGHTYLANTVVTALPVSG